MYNCENFMHILKMNNRGFSTIELALVITFMGILTLFSYKATVWIKNKKLDFVISEVNNLIRNNSSISIKSNFNQDTEWLIVRKDFNGEDSIYHEITRYKNTNLFSEIDILYILKKTNDDRMYITNNGIIISKELINNNKNKNDRVYGIAIKK